MLFKSYLPCFVRRHNPYRFNPALAPDTRYCFLSHDICKLSNEVPLPEAVLCPELGLVSVDVVSLVRVPPKVRLV